MDGAFLPTAVTFVAFQYGGQVLAKMAMIHENGLLLANDDGFFSLTHDLIQ